MLPDFRGESLQRCNVTPLIGSNESPYNFKGKLSDSEKLADEYST